MKKPAAPGKAQTGFFEEVSTPNCTGKPPVFKGTNNPRALRLLHLLLNRPSVSREAVDREAGCSNGPALVATLRELGLGETHLPCTRIKVIDRDGRACFPGVYYLSEPGRKAIIRQLSGVA